jgi:hypothetical protein
MAAIMGEDDNNGVLSGSVRGVTFWCCDDTSHRHTSLRSRGAERFGIRLTRAIIEYPILSVVRSSKLHVDAEQARRGAPLGRFCPFSRFLVLRTFVFPRRSQNPRFSFHVISFSTTATLVSNT